MYVRTYVLLPKYILDKLMMSEKFLQKKTLLWQWGGK